MPHSGCISRGCTLWAAATVWFPFPPPLHYRCGWVGGSHPSSNSLATGSPSALHLRLPQHHGLCCTMLSPGAGRGRRNWRGGLEPLAVAAAGAIGWSVASWEPEVRRLTPSVAYQLDSPGLRHSHSLHNLVWQLWFVRSFQRNVLVNISTLAGCQGSQSF